LQALLKIKSFIIIAFMAFTLNAIAVTNDNTKNTNSKTDNVKPEDKVKMYNDEKISYEAKQEFDELYPLNINNFYFFKGEKKITFKEFLDLSKDPYLLKFQEKVKKVRLTGFSTAIISGVVGSIFLIPGIIFITSESNFSPIDQSYFFTGVGMIGAAGLSGLIALIDLIVTFSLLHKFQYSEYAVKQAVERYNENLRVKLKIMPELSFNNDNFTIGLNFKI
jgi:hypothetical protein